MLKSFEIFKLDSQHVPEIDELHSQGYGSALPLEYWQQLTSDRRYRAYAAVNRHGGGVVGFIAFRFLGPTLFVDRIVVSRRYRNSGVGRSLLGIATAKLDRTVKVVAIRPTSSTCGFLNRCGFAPMTRDVWIAREDLINV